jgi:hypothetical protein
VIQLLTNNAIPKSPDPYIHFSCPYFYRIAIYIVVLAGVAFACFQVVRVAMKRANDFPFFTPAAAQFGTGMGAG